MAKKEEAPASEATEAPAAPSRKKKILILAIMALLILVLVGGGGLFALNYSKKKHKPAEGENEEEVAAEQEKKKKEEDRKKNPPVFAKLDTFTVNLQKDKEGGDQYLQVSITLKIENAAADASMKSAMPEIRDSIIRLLSSKKASELITSEGKDALAEELKNTLNQLLNPDQQTPKKGKKKKETEGPVLAVLFTDFIIQ